MHLHFILTATMIQLQSNRVVSSDDLDRMIEAWKADNHHVQSSKLGSSLMVYDSVGNVKVAATILATGLVDLKEWY